MRPPARALVVGLGALLVALAICAVLPVIDPRCGVASPGVAMLGSCGPALGGLARDLILLGMLTAAAIVAIVAALIAHQAAAHHRLSESLRRTAVPAVVADIVIGVVPGVAAAVVAGLRTPRIYCSEDVLVTLEADELAAVILHERHHAQTYAPAKLVALAALARLIGRTRSGAAWIESERSRIEIAADDHAITNGATRPALAGAILKLAHGSPTQTLAGFASAADRRIRALLGEASTAPRTRRPMPMIILGPVAAVVACALLPML